MFGLASLMGGGGGSGGGIGSMMGGSPSATSGTGPLTVNNGIKPATLLIVAGILAAAVVAWLFLSRRKK